MLVTDIDCEAPFSVATGQEVGCACLGAVWPRHQHLTDFCNLILCCLDSNRMSEPNYSGTCEQVYPLKYTSCQSHCQHVLSYLRSRSETGIAMQHDEVAVL